MLKQTIDPELEQLFADGPVSHQTMLRFLHEIERIDQEEIAFANSLLPSAGDYLNGRWLRRFITADISDDDARRWMSRQKALVGRLCALFPTVLRYVTLEEKRRALNILSMIYGCANDYDYVISNGRRDANRKKIVNNIRNVGDMVEKLLNFSDWNYIGYSEFENAYKSYHKGVKEVEGDPLTRLQHDLKFLGCFLKLSLYRAQSEADYIKPPDNQAKTRIVDCAYTVSLWWRGPPLVTTPGSDFSAMCSLIFEIATGIADESLAGAINRFARSQERAQADKDELDYGPAWERARNDDNFYDIKETSLSLQNKIEKLNVTLLDPSLPVEATAIVRSLLDDAIEEAERNENEHGPFQMWASQVKGDWSAELQLSNDLESLRLRLDIEIGKRRRAARERG
ncbi:hypothetical protein AC244_22235 [Ensifer adhaerens]|uniref:Uncharacterized protein n=1 Tax=Ensifer adhaerens TaxID=106592 RepID=A0A0L8BMA2_ENSAD|nr:hypothetical protein [Ensifer adhaerens]KOF15715.1 hypothetical protein AC244_22235 [Ensifer adhaerens]